MRTETTTYRIPATTAYTQTHPVSLQDEPTFLRIQ